MEYDMGFEIIAADLNTDTLLSIILGEVNKKEVVKIETRFSTKEEINQINSHEQLAEGIPRLKSSKPRQECWRIYLDIEAAQLSWELSSRANKHWLTWLGQESFDEIFILLWSSLESLERVNAVANVPGEDSYEGFILMPSIASQGKCADK